MSRMGFEADHDLGIETRKMQKVTVCSTFRSYGGVVTLVCHYSHLFSGDGPPLLFPVRIICKDVCSATVKTSLIDILRDIWNCVYDLLFNFHVLYSGCISSHLD